MSVTDVTMTNTEAVLRALRRSGRPMTYEELQQLTKVNSAALRMAVSRLAAKQLVESPPKVIRLTRKGKVSNVSKSQ